MKWKSTKKRKKLLISLVTIVILIPSLILMFKKPQEAEAAWFDDSYGYRVKSVVSNGGSSQTDFQVKITIDTATAITAGKMNSDCSDIRIIDNGGCEPCFS